MRLRKPHRYIAVDGLTVNSRSFTEFLLFTVDLTLTTANIDFPDRSRRFKRHYGDFYVTEFRKQSFVDVWREGGQLWDENWRENWGNWAIFWGENERLILWGAEEGGKTWILGEVEVNNSSETLESWEHWDETGGILEKLGF